MKLLSSLKNCKHLMTHIHEPHSCFRTWQPWMFQKATLTLFLQKKERKKEKMVLSKNGLFQKNCIHRFVYMKKERKCWLCKVNKKFFYPAKHVESSHVININFTYTLYKRSKKVPYNCVNSNIGHIEVKKSMSTSQKN